VRPTMHALDGCSVARQGEPTQTPGPPVPAVAEIPRRETDKKMNRRRGGIGRAGAIILPLVAAHRLVHGAEGRRVVAGAIAPGAVDGDVEQNGWDRCASLRFARRADAERYPRGGR